MKNTALQPADTPKETAYVIKEHGGKIAVFNNGETQPLAVYEIYVHLLPENDIEMLRRGIKANDDYTLLKTLENFGL